MRNFIMAVMTVICLQPYTDAAVKAPPLIKGVAYVYLHSLNGASLKKWYHDKLGLHFKEPVPGWNETDFGTGSEFSIESNSEPRTVVQKQPVTLMFQVDDIQRDIQRLLKNGVKFYIPKGSKTPVISHGPVKIATFIDPDHNFVQLIQVPHVK